MTPQERDLIQGLFDRIHRTSGGQKDPEAAQLIGDEVDGNPHAPYYLVQAVLFQEQALKAADARIRELEAAAAGQPEAPRGGGSFLSGASPWGPRPSERQPPETMRTIDAPRYDAPRVGDAPRPGFGPRGAVPPPYNPAAYAAQPQGDAPQPPQPPAAGRAGGFLGGALQTAAGVAGGALLFQGISSLMGGHGFGGGGSSAQGISGDKGGAQDGYHPAAGEDISGFGNKQGFADNASQDGNWHEAGATDGSWDQGAVQDAGWSDDDGGDWGGEDI